MIQLQTKVNIIDNSGGLIGQCINIANPVGRKYAQVGDIIVISIKKALPGSKIKKGGVYKAIVARTKKGVRQRGIFFGQWADNGVILIKNQKDLTPIGTRIKGGISRYLKYLRNSQKIIALSKVFK